MKKTSPAITKLNSCRVCCGSTVEKFLHFSAMPFTDDFIPPARIGSEFLADIDIYICPDCYTAQTQQDIDVGSYYEDYQYSVGTSAIASRFMRRLAENTIEKFFPSQTNPLKVLEIGSGDGEQLLAFKEAGCDVLGFEPSSALCNSAAEKGIRTIQGLFSHDSAVRLPSNFQTVDIVVLSYTFDHLPNPRDFLRTCQSILNKTQGLLVVEVHDFEKILARNEYCLFEHEHSVYLTEETALGLCRLEGYEVIDFDLVAEAERRANSLIFVATPKGSCHAKRSTDARTPPEYRDLGFYRTIGRHIEKGIANLEDYVASCSESGQSVAGYGAGGRGVMTLAAMKNAANLKYLADRRPKGVGLVTPKSGIPVVGLDSFRVTPVAEVLVFSYGYMQEIKDELGRFGYKPQKLRSMLDVLNGRFDRC